MSVFISQFLKGINYLDEVLRTKIYQSVSQNKCIRAWKLVYRTFSSMKFISSAISIGIVKLTSSNVIYILLRYLLKMLSKVNIGYLKHMLFQVWSKSRKINLIYIRLRNYKHIFFLLNHYASYIVHKTCIGFPSAIGHELKSQIRVTSRSLKCSFYGENNCKVKQVQKIGIYICEYHNRFFFMLLLKRH